jgi:hypothetical protein
MADFEIRIDADELTYGDYLDMSSGDAQLQSNCLSRYVFVGDKQLDEAEGLKRLRSLKLKELESVMKNVTEEMAGDNVPN